MDHLDDHDVDSVERPGHEQNRYNHASQSCRPKMQDRSLFSLAGDVRVRQDLETLGSLRRLRGQRPEGEAVEAEMIQRSPFEAWTPACHSGAVVLQQTQAFDCRE
ncbi:unnamed protein product [Symbiodinium sp. CCMP2592]|nr:unnamed protein product [Symbiodinium sp. CCMP2592]